MQDSSIKWANALVPAPLYHAVRFAWTRLQRRTKSYEARYPTRKDVIRYDLQRDVYVDVFWKVLSVGRGPAASLFVYGDEVLRFDCYGKDTGHYHIELYTPDLTAEQRLRFSEQAVEEQIERTIFELNTNLPYYLQRHPRRRVRRVTVDPASLDRVCEQTRERMLYYLRTVPELHDLQAPVKTS